ncbi:MAG: class I SAM-dependent methyltransferase [Acidimicrobiales bacterium]|nr:class I SAM-dependent methyltransferase [Acidimicrobiales bacterium]
MLVCSQCEHEYPHTPEGQLDLRLAVPLTVPTEALLGRPQVPAPPTDLIRPLSSYLPAGEGRNVLDYGCGNQRSRPLLERSGYHYIGIDYADPAAPLLADGHRLPFVDGFFDVVWSIAVLEQFRYPEVALSEVRRVLKPGGMFIGNVTWQTPYIPGVHFSWSHVGLTNLLTDTGFAISTFVVDPEWTSTPSALAMGYFPAMSARMAKALAKPLHAAHRAYWSVATRTGKVRARSGEAGRVLPIAASIGFVATAR